MLDGVSVIIPAYNAAATLSPQLEALVAQQVDRPYQVIVADNGSQDATVEVAESFSDRLDLVVVDASARRGPGAARNQGAAVARYGAIAFCDADDVVVHRWLDSIVTAVEAGSTWITGPLNHVAFDEVAFDDDFVVKRRAPRRYLGQLPFASTNNMAVLASAFREVAGFREHYRCAEDADISIRLGLAGHKLDWAPEMAVHARLRPDLRSHLRQHYRYGFEAPMVLNEFRTAGLRREPARAVLRAYASIFRRTHQSFTKRRWAVLADVANRSGRVVGSIRQRTLCL